MAILNGACYHSMDAKNRIRIPSKLKAELLKDGGSLHFVQYSEGCITVMNDAVLEKRFGSFEDIDTLDDEVLDALRFILSKIEDVEEDSQGRTVLSKNMREYIGVDQEHAELVTAGVKDCLEIWRADKYQERFMQKDIRSAKEILSQFKASQKESK